MDMQTQAKLKAAASLIKAKDYAAARQVLRGVNHPTAYEWLARIDVIDPIPAQVVYQSPTREDKVQAWSMVIALTVVFLPCSICSMLALFGSL